MLMPGVLPDQMPYKKLDLKTRLWRANPTLKLKSDLQALLQLFRDALEVHEGCKHQAANALHHGLQCDLQQASNDHMHSSMSVVYLVFE